MCRAYSKQITNIAIVDARLVTALQRIRSGDFVYGVDTGQGPLLGSYCYDLGLARRLGDPAQTVPIPCQVMRFHRARLPPWMLDWRMPRLRMPRLWMLTR